jgi:undecaprenyl-diphosphatase
MFRIITGEYVQNFDSAVYDALAKQISPVTTCFMKLFTFLGSELALTSLAALTLFTGVFWKKGKRFKHCLFICLNLGGGALFSLILKNIFRRPRPNIMQLIEITGYSFPSGHSMNSLIFYGFLIYLSLRYMKHWSKYCISFGLALLILFIGISRIYLGVHYASDVIGGFILGIFWLIVSIWVFKKMPFNRLSKI